MHFLQHAIVLAIFLLSVENFVGCLLAEEKSFSTSIAGMEHLLAMEQILIASVEQFASEMESKVQQLKKWVNNGNLVGKVFENWLWIQPCINLKSF